MKSTKLLPRKTYELKDLTKFHNLKNHMFKPEYLSSLYSNSLNAKIDKRFRVDLAVQSISKEQTYTKICWLLNGKLQGLWDFEEGNKFLAPAPTDITSKNSVILNKFEDHRSIQKLNLTKRQLKINAENFTNSLSSRSILQMAFNGELSSGMSVTDIVKKLNLFYKKELII